MSKIIIPLPEKEKIDFYLENVVDGFLIGINDFSENFNNTIDINEISEFTDLLNKKEKDIYIVLNKLCFNNKIDELKELLFKLSEEKITGVMFDDLAVLNIVKENNLNINLIWYGIHKAVNSKTINFLSKRGIKGVMLSNEITIDEILKILENINVKVFITLFGYTNVATSSRKLLTNYFEFTKKEKKGNKYYIKEKKDDKYYPIIEGENTNFFSGKILNGIKEYPKIINNEKIEAIFLDNYLINEYSFYNVIEAFNAIKQSPEDKEFIDKLSNVIESNNYGNTYDGFLNKETIFKVKDYE